MSKNEITILTDVSLITCVVQRGKADEVIKAAQEVGAQGATINYARGTGMRESLGVLGLAIDVEKEAINILVANDQIDRVFEKMFIAGKLDTPGMGIIYELDAIAMAVIGGVSLTGGRGSIIGTVLGALIFGVIISGFTYLKLDAFYQEMVKGAIIVAAVVLDQWRQARAAAKA